MEELLLTNSSVVLVTASPVPFVTHEFLVNQNIIPEDFQIQGTPFYTPPVSQIKYNNGLNIITEPNKIQLSKSVIKEEEKKDCVNELKEISLKYVELFNDIKCNSIGINFQFIRDDLKFSSLIDKTIKSDSSCLKFEDHKGEVGRIDVSYNWKGKQLNVVINKIKKINPSPPIDVVLFNININYPNTYGEKATIIGELTENFEKSQQFIKGI